jgi:phytoene dehydrogenase-like protein
VDRVEGVGLADGARLRAGRAVLADVPAAQLYESLVGREHLSGQLRRDLGRFHWDNATIKLNWALSGPAPWKVAEVGDAGTVHLGGDMDDFTQYSADIAMGRVPRRPFVVLGQMTRADPSRSPVGTESLWAYAHLPPRAAAAETARGFAESIEDEVERYAPGFRDLVIARTVQDGESLEHDDPSLHNGALGGGTSAIHQQLVFRPTPGLGRADTPFPGLFLASASAHPGGGVHGACGANAARAALRRARVGARVYDGSVGRAQRWLG